MYEKLKHFNNKNAFEVVMKKIACLSAVAACVLAVTAGTAFAGESTVSAGYAQGDLQGVANKAGGFNLKYRYEYDNSPLGVIGSFTHLEKNNSEDGFYNKAQYNSITAGPCLSFQRLGEHLRCDRCGLW
ncbi:Outer membrane protein X precursor [Serratia fonticola]|uniref:Outer membrane protein X n=1 Tax=Serratia fonticola TaxID=47917 RepID=A0A4V6KJZ1_SERFO|nr:Outer membrane protein X precursor [Serratia fonticola]